MRLFFLSLWALVQKDLRLEWRHKEHWLAMLGFAFLTLLIFAFSLNSAVHFRLNTTVLHTIAFDSLPPQMQKQLQLLGRTSYAHRENLLAALKSIPLKPRQKAALLQAARRTTAQAGAPGFIWATFLLAGILGLGKSFAQEQENGCLQALLQAPISREVIYLSKVLSTALPLAALVVVLFFLAKGLFHLPLPPHPWAILPFALGGVFGFASLGTLLASMTTGMRGREVLLPLLLFPLLTPLILALVQLSTAWLEGESLPAQSPWGELLGGAGLAFFILAVLTFEAVVED